MCHVCEMRQLFGGGTCVICRRRGGRIVLDSGAMACAVCAIKRVWLIGYAAAEHDELQREATRILAEEAGVPAGKG